MISIFTSLISRLLAASNTIGQRDGSFSVRESRVRGFSFGAETLILSASDSPSVAYLLIPHLAKRHDSSVRVISDVVRPELLVNSDCRALIIARYLPHSWVKPVRKFRESGGRVIYFMDDDLMDLAAAASLPKQYARKIARTATSRRADLEDICDEFWVGSSYLLEKYKHWNAKLLLSRPSIAELSSIPVVTVCYHGTASHWAELQWLHAVVAALQATSSNVQFEVFGDHSVNKLYRELPRVTVLHPMSWRNYLAYTGSVQRDIALAPLTAHPFNAARGHTKFFDFVRMGAVGIYTDVAPYRGFIRDGIDGVLLPNDPELWVSTIANLIADEPRRRRMAEAARQRALAMAWDAEQMPDSA